MASKRFDFGGDTLRFETFAEDSLRAIVPGIFPQRVIAVDGRSFASQNLALRLTLVHDSAGQCRGLQVNRNGRSVFAPKMGYSVQATRELISGLPETVPDTVSRHGGTAVDMEPTLDGMPRFADAADSLFLRAGDGWIHRLGTSHPAGFALGKGGEYLLLRIPGLAGRIASVTLILKPEAKAGKGRLRFSAFGGPSESDQRENLGEEGWWH